MTQERILNFALIGVGTMIKKQKSIQEKHKKETGEDDITAQTLWKTYLKDFSEIIELIKKEEQKKEKSC